MRIGNPTNNEFFLELNKINEEVQNSFLKRMVHETRNVSCDVMLGDSTTKKDETFDVKNVETFFGKFFVISLCWSFSFQILNEIRHLAWDMGYGFDLKVSQITGIATILGSFILAILFYFAGKSFI